MTTEKLIAEAYRLINAGEVTGVAKVDMRFYLEKASEGDATRLEKAVAHAHAAIAARGEKSLAQDSAERKAKAKKIVAAAKAEMKDENGDHYDWRDDAPCGMFPNGF